MNNYELHITAAIHEVLTCESEYPAGVRQNLKKALIATDLLAGQRNNWLARAHDLAERNTRLAQKVLDLEAEIARLTHELHDAQDRVGWLQVSGDYEDAAPEETP